MSGNNEHDPDPANLTTDEPCPGACCGCGCSCDLCFCRLNLNADNEANREAYPGQGTAPIPINNDIRAVLDFVAASFDEDVIGPNDARLLPGAPFALTHANISELVHSFSDSGNHQADWLARIWLAKHGREVDENPAPWFVERVPNDSEMIDDEGVFNMELEGSMMVEDSVAGDSRSTITCSKSHSSRTPSQVLPENRPTPGFISCPLPLLEETTCKNCGGEHD